MGLLKPRREKNTTVCRKQKKAGFHEWNPYESEKRGG
jgi:hypothetical protein